MEKLLSPVRPYLTKTTSSLNPLVERATVLKAGVEDRLPEIAFTGLNFVKEKVNCTLNILSLLSLLVYLLVSGRGDYYVPRL